jgi:hypothetical protein
MLRKNILKQDRSETVPPAMSATMISIPDVASVLVSSEDSLHPIDHVFDDHNGPGGTRWIAGEVGEQTIIVAFDRPLRLQKVNLEIEEPEMSRTQELSLGISGKKRYLDRNITFRRLTRRSSANGGRCPWRT